MRPADTTPAPLFPEEQTNPAKSPPVRQATSPAGKDPNILIIEDGATHTGLLIAALRQATGWNLVHAKGPHDLFLQKPMLHSAVKIAIITVARSCDAVDIIKEIKEFAFANKCCVPRLLVLSLTPLGPQASLRLERLGAQCLLRAYPDQIVDVVRTIQWQLRIDKSLPTLIVRRIAGHVAEVVLRYDRSETPLNLGPRIRALVEHLVLYSKTEHTTEMIADALGICLQSAKAYLSRLRGSVHRACVLLGLHFSGSEIVWTRMADGGYLHGLRCNVEIEDR